MRWIFPTDVPKTYAEAVASEGNWEEAINDKLKS